MKNSEQSACHYYIVTIPYQVEFYRADNSKSHAYRPAISENGPAAMKGPGRLCAALRPRLARFHSESVHKRWPWDPKLIRGMACINDLPMFRAYFGQDWQSHLVFHKLESEFSFDLWHDAAHQQLVGVVRADKHARLCGHPRVMHGGLQATLLDEAMGLLLAMCAHQPAYTATMSVDFVRPLKLPCEAYVTARLKSTCGRKLRLEAELASAPPDAAAAAGDRPDKLACTDTSTDADADTNTPAGFASASSLFSRCDALFVQPRDKK